MYSLAQTVLAGLRYSPEDIASLRRLGEYLGKQELFARQWPEVLETLRAAAVIESSESSNRLEGIVAPKSRIKALVLKGTSPRNRSEQEIAGYRDALNLLHQSARDMPFAVNVILQLHATIYRYLPQPGGSWKMTDNEIVERSQDGEIVRVRFTPVSAVSTPHAMEELARRYRAARQENRYDPLVLIPLTILGQPAACLQGIRGSARDHRPRPRLQDAASARGCGAQSSPLSDRRARARLPRSEPRDDSASPASTSR